MFRGTDTGLGVDVVTGEVVVRRPTVQFSCTDTGLGVDVVRRAIVQRFGHGVWG